MQKLSEGSLHDVCETLVLWERAEMKDRGFTVKPGRPRAARYAFVASATLTDLETGLQTQENTEDLSLYGCRIVPGTSKSPGTRVRVQIKYNGESFEAQGRVIHVRPTAGIGIMFTKTEERHQLLLDKWIAALRSQKKAIVPV